MSDLHITNNEESISSEAQSTKPTNSLDEFLSASEGLSLFDVVHSQLLKDDESGQKENANNDKLVSYDLVLIRKPSALAAQDTGELRLVLQCTEIPKQIQDTNLTTNITTLSNNLKDLSFTQLFQAENIFDDKKGTKTIKTEVSSGSHNGGANSSDQTELHYKDGQDINNQVQSPVTTQSIDFSSYSPSHQSTGQLSTFQTQLNRDSVIQSSQHASIQQGEQIDLRLLGESSVHLPAKFDASKVHQAQFNASFHDPALYVNQQIGPGVTSVQCECSSNDGAIRHTTHEIRSSQNRAIPIIVHTAPSISTSEQGSKLNQAQAISSTQISVSQRAQYIVAADLPFEGQRLAAEGKYQNTDAQSLLWNFSTPSNLQCTQPLCPFLSQSFFSSSSRPSYFQLLHPSHPQSHLPLYPLTPSPSQQHIPVPSYPHIYFPLHQTTPHPSNPPTPHSSISHIPLSQIQQFSNPQTYPNTPTQPLSYPSQSYISPQENLEYIVLEHLQQNTSQTTVAHSQHQQLADAPVNNPQLQQTQTEQSRHSYPLLQSLPFLAFKETQSAEIHSQRPSSLLNPQQTPGSELGPAKLDQEQLARASQQLDQSKSLGLKTMELVNIIEDKLRKSETFQSDENSGEKSNNVLAKKENIEFRSKDIISPVKDITSPVKDCDEAKEPQGLSPNVPSTLPEVHSTVFQNPGDVYLTSKNVHLMGVNITTKHVEDPTNQTDALKAPLVNEPCLSENNPENISVKSRILEIEKTKPSILEKIARDIKNSQEPDKDTEKMDKRLLVHQSAEQIAEDISNSDFTQRDDRGSSSINRRMTILLKVSDDDHNEGDAQDKQEKGNNRRMVTPIVLADENPPAVVTQASDDLLKKNNKNQDGSKRNNEMQCEEVKCKRKKKYIRVDKTECVQLCRCPSGCCVCIKAYPKLSCQKGLENESTKACCKTCMSSCLPSSTSCLTTSLTHTGQSFSSSYSCLHTAQTPDYCRNTDTFACCTQRLPYSSNYLNNISCWPAASAHMILCHKKKAYNDGGSCGELHKSRSVDRKCCVRKKIDANFTKLHIVLRTGDRKSEDSCCCDTLTEGAQTFDCDCTDMFIETSASLSSEEEEGEKENCKKVSFSSCCVTSKEATSEECSTEEEETKDPDSAV